MPDGILSQFRRAVDDYERRTGCRPTRIRCDRDARTARDRWAHEVLGEPYPEGGE